jgi:4-hydroxy-tetrahydrodipicolinate synthase
MEGNMALKHALVARGIFGHATVRSPLLSLPDGAEEEIHAAVRSAKLNRAAINGK